jgi:type IV secretory pathway TraG/TraD family ATPase VirD4
MNDSKAALNFLYAIVMFLFGMMAYYYILIVNTTLVPPNFVNDFLAPMSIQFSDSFKIAFLVISIFIFILSPASEMMADTTKEFYEKHRYQLLLVFLISMIGILFSGSFTKFMFMLVYPLCVVIFWISGFILRAILQKQNPALKDEFGFKHCYHEVKHPDNFVWREDKKYLNIEKFNYHTLLIGGPGAGKSFTIIEPMIEQAVMKGYSLIIFDFKMNGNFSTRKDQWALTHYAYRSMLKYSKPAKKDENGKWIGEHSVTNDRRKIYVINFRDVRYSNRCNPIHPMYLESEGFANEYSMTLLQNMKPEWVKSKDFFADSAIIYFKGILWWARNEYDGDFCTLPHCMEIAQHDYKRVLAVVSQNEDCRRIVSSISVASKTGAGAQLAGVISTLQTAIQKATDPNINWVLSGNDFSLRLNDPENPGILCFGSDPELPETYGPVSALIAKVATKVMNQPGRNKSLAVLDELPRLAIPQLDATLATSRSNNFGFVLAGQDLAQFLQIWTKEQTESLLANCGNVLVGQNNNPQTKKEYSEMIGTREKVKKSTNTGKSMGESLSKSSGENISEQKENLINVHEIGVLKIGEFFGKVAVTSDYDNFFRIRPQIKKIDIDFVIPQILKNSDGIDFPATVKETEINNAPKKRTTNLHKVTETDPVKIMVENNQNKIREDVAYMIVNECLHYIVNFPEEEKALFPTHFWLNPTKKEETKVIEFDAEFNWKPLFEGITDYNFKDGCVVGIPDFSKPIY